MVICGLECKVHVATVRASSIRNDQPQNSFVINPKSWSCLKEVQYNKACTDTLSSHWKREIPWREKVFWHFPCPGGTQALLGLPCPCDTAPGLWMGQTECPSSPDSGQTAAQNLVTEPFSSVRFSFQESRGYRLPHRLGKMHLYRDLKNFICKGYHCSCSSSNQ